MSIDILTVNAVLGRNKELQDEYDTAMAQLRANIPANSPGQMCFVPLMEGGSSFKVCGTCYSGGCTCKMIGDKCCAWTVPSGVTEVQFQIWGSGSDNAGACCCGGSPFGATGAYTFVRIPTTAGQIYCICSGGIVGGRTGFCCSNAGACGGCQSHVNGPGLSSVCADGGESHLNCSMCDLEGRTSAYYRFSKTDSGGACMCDSCTWYCGNSCASCGEIPIHKSSERTWHGTVSGTDSVITGIPSWWGGGEWNTSMYGFHTAAPVVKEDHTIFAGSCMKHSFQSETCSGGGDCSTNASSCGLWNVHPGMGGSSNHAMGGGNYIRSDLGRTGMVKITYK